MNKKSNGQNNNRQRMAGGKTKDYRFFLVAAVFVIILIAFCAYMMFVLHKGPTKAYEQYDVRTEIVPGERGRIFDRNGNLLVGNSTYYDFTFEYGAMAYSSKEINAALLSCLDALRDTNTEDMRSKDYFVLTGSYPNMSLNKDAYDLGTDVGHYFNKFLIRHELPTDTDASGVAEFFVKKYKLNENGLSNTQITQLIRLYYDMDRIGFGAYQPYTLAEGFIATNADHMKLISRIKEKRIEGATFIKQTKRVYNYGDYAAHILGSIGKIYAEDADKYLDMGYSLNALVGKSGVELAFEDYLRGSDGKRVLKYDKDGNLVEEYYDPAPTVGNDIYLTIDIDLQIAAEDALSEQLEELDHSEAGAATAIDPNTGEVLVIASRSTYTQQNLALYGLFAPGSTYKIGTALAALEEKHVTPYTSYNCTQECNFGPNCLGLHNNITISDAICVSCNVFFDYLGIEMGLDKITPYTKKLGLGVATGIELGEAVGTIASEEYAGTLDSYTWRSFDDAAGAIGQSLHAYTPLQLSVYMSSVVNGGTRYSAHLLRSVSNRAGDSVTAIKPDVADTIEFSQNTYDILISSMRAVVTENLRSVFSGVDVAVGGKTGTAETGKQTDNALFSGFAPLSSPEIVASCVLEEGEGGTNAAKVVAAIFEAYFAPEEEIENEADAE